MNMMALTAYKDALVRECLVGAGFDPATATPEQWVSAKRSALTLCKAALEANVIADHSREITVSAPRTTEPDSVAATLAAKSGLFKQVLDRQRDEFLAHLKPEVIARRQLGTPITWAEVQTMRCNSYEWQHLAPLFDNDALMRQVQHALNNSDHGGCPSTEYSRPCVTYPEQLERLLVPLLIQRLAAATGLTVPDFEIDTDAGFEPGEDDDATP